MQPQTDVGPDGKAREARAQREANSKRPGALGAALTKPETQHDLKLNLLIYRDHYFKIHSDLITANNVTKDTTVAGGIIGVIGGLAKSTSTVYTGGAIAAGSSIYGQRYEFTIQALNYRKASIAMDCMLGVVAPLKDANPLSKAGITSASDSIEEVRRKLYQAQSAVVLKDPDLKQLKNALIVEELADTKHRAFVAKGLVPLAVGASLPQEEEDLVLARVDECAKSF
ncbi:hypothetical protein A7D21_28245 [Pseudomonas sp. AP19]|nr:hypothetical protein [Pseudomonas fluorescens]OEC67964.1 hypothetical protein A7D21_28245 [Pseudomonas sp. AP19]